MPRPLTDLAPGETGRLAAPQHGCAVPRRLLDLGFVPGTPLRMVRHAPLGDPVEIELRGYRVCLRREQLGGLEVEDGAGA
jgi:ferrous iron transport protein A